MLLAIDIGNTNIVLGLYDADMTGTDGSRVDAPLVRDWRMRTEPRMTADELALTVRGLLGDYADKITGISALSTVPALLRELRVMLDRYWTEVPRVVVEPGVRTGVPLLVDNPKEVGADRVINTLAAHHLHSTNCVVVDFGTSTNIDVISARGEFLGGVFAPGIEISLDALGRRGAQLREVELTRPRSVIARNTVEALQSGVLFGFAGQVDRIVDKMIDDLGADADDVSVVATGGLAETVLDECETVTDHEPWLTLTGLRLVHERNTR